MKTVAIILTYNEERHLERCILSLQNVFERILVVDSFSSDKTVDTALKCGARVVQRAWTYHSDQFNWALSQLEPDTDWVFRLDADEVVTNQLAKELAGLGAISSAISGVYCGRRIAFQGRLIKHGGVFPIQVLRLFRYGRGECEDRLMDEHIQVEGRTIRFSGEIVDNNLNSISWWIEKHNAYASREAIEMLNLKYRFLARVEKVRCAGERSQPNLKRWIKEKIYAKMPIGSRACAYFLYRYVIRLGFLDGAAGLNFHFLQGFWYRYLVDVKIAEVELFMRDRKAPIDGAIQAVLNFNFTITKNLK